MEEWIQHVAAELGVDADVAVDPLLAAAREVAHSVERRATPVTTYLIGLAAATPGADVEALCNKVRAMAREWTAS